MDERYSENFRACMWPDLSEEERPLWRHIEIGNLKRVGAPPRVADYP